MRGIIDIRTGFRTRCSVIGSHGTEGDGGGQDQSRNYADVFHCYAFFHQGSLSATYL
nr:MAG TPA: hypothetical protein [Caudoviricetes sp.]